jgi:hypothetical protein
MRSAVIFDLVWIDIVSPSHARAAYYLPYRDYQGAVAALVSKQPCLSAQAAFGNRGASIRASLRPRRSSPPGTEIDVADDERARCAIVTVDFPNTSVSR